MMKMDNMNEWWLIQLAEHLLKRGNVKSSSVDLVMTLSLPYMIFRINHHDHTQVEDVLTHGSSLYDLFVVQKGKSDSIIVSFSHLLMISTSVMLCHSSVKILELVDAFGDSFWLPFKSKLVTMVVVTIM